MSRPGRKNTPSNSNQDPIEVFCRLRPLPENQETCVEILSDTSLKISAPKKTKSSNRVDQIQCTFDKILPEYVSQREVFEHLGLPLVQDLLVGKNSLCFMYGITGSGKTFTMNGDPTNGGVLPRCLDTVFNSINHLQTERCTFKSDGFNGYSILTENGARSEAETKYAEMEDLLKNQDIYDSARLPDTTILQVDEDNNYAVFISFVEIYNNSIFDLLEKESFDKFNHPKQPTSKILREDPKRHMFVYEAIEYEIKSTEEASALFWMGQDRRRTAHTLLNTESSRSHSVFTIKLVQAPLGPNGATIMKDPNLVRVSQLSLCDLAGSERVSRTKTEGENIRQAGHINNSLMTLRTCIESLRENQKYQDSVKMVPYRDSKLTHLFKNYFDGEGKVRMVVCLNPSSADYDESIHVMRFAEMTQEVKVARSEAVKFDIGLTAGRGKAMRQIKAAKCDDPTSSDTASQDDDILPPLTQFPNWPLCLISGHNDSTTLVGLMHYLEERMKLRSTLQCDWNQKQMEVRQMILQLEQDNMDLTKAMEEQRGVLGEKEKEAKQTEKKIRALNEKYESLQRSTQTFEVQKREMLSEVEKYKEMAHKERQEKLKVKQVLKEKNSNERLQWEKECHKRVHSKHMEMEGEVFLRDEKLRQLKNVVSNLQLPKENQIRLSEIIADGKQYSGTQTTTTTSSKQTKERTSERNENREKSERKEKKSESKHSSNKTKKGPTIQPKPPRARTHERTHTISGSTPRKPQVRSKSPPPPSTLRRNDAPPIRGAHRRSRSQDFWLHHKPSETLNTDTMMQPVIKNKKTVHKPSVKDLKAIPNYILTHQEEDSGGEIETKLVKGQVHETQGGGSSVQFTNIETLKKTLQDRAFNKTQTQKEVKDVQIEQVEKIEKVAKTPTIKTSKTPSKSNIRKRKSAEDDSGMSEDSWSGAEPKSGSDGNLNLNYGVHQKKFKA